MNDECYIEWMDSGRLRIVRGSYDDLEDTLENLIEDGYEATMYFF